MVKFKASRVFHDIWEALNEKKTENGITQSRYKLIVEEGSSRSSKTWSNFQVLFLYLMSNPLSSVTVLRDTQKSCRDIVEKDWREWLKDPQNRRRELDEGKINVAEFDAFLKKENLNQYLIENKTHHTWTFKHNGNFIRFTGLDDENEAMGMTQTICWINEPYAFSHEVYKQLAQRSKVILFDWNPKQNHWIEKEKRKENTFVHYSTFRDNPFILEETKTQLLSYQPVKWAKAVIDKKIKEKEAKYYDTEKNPLKFDKKDLSELKRCIYNEKVGSASEYHWLVYGLGLKSEKPNKIYNGWEVISREKYDEVYQQKNAVKFYGLDYGFANPTALVEVFFDGDYSFYVKPLLYKPMRLLGASLGDTLISLGVPVGGNTYIWADSADREAGSDISITNDLRSGFNLNAVPTHKPTYKARFEFINKCKVYYVENGEFEHEYENYEYEYIQGVPTERPIKKDDHYMNALEYCIWGIKEYYDIKF